MATDFPGEVPKTTEGQADKPVEEFKPGGQETPESFESMMEQPEGGMGAEKTGGPSPFDLPQRAQSSGPPTMDDLRGQMDIASGELNKTEENLKKNPKFNQSQKYLIKKKLGTAQDNIRYVSGKMGNEQIPFVSKAANPIDRFLDMIQDSQDQISGASKKMQKASQSKDSMNPGEMLHIQTKIQKANIELNFVSILVADAASGIKTMFNMQI
ncbi:MAG: hypothetical protein ChlgKO_13120 [Chlamydiales bacterium]